jgi:hypothetical protein
MRSTPLTTASLFAVLSTLAAACGGAQGGAPGATEPSATMTSASTGGRTDISTDEVKSIIEDSMGPPQHAGMMEARQIDEAHLTTHVTPNEQQLYDGFVQGINAATKNDYYAPVDRTRQACAFDPKWTTDIAVVKDAQMVPPWGAVAEGLALFCEKGPAFQKKAQAIKVIHFVLAKHKLEVEKGFDLTLDRATGELTVGVRVYNAENIAAHLGNWMSTQ